MTAIPNIPSPSSSTSRRQVRGLRGSGQRGFPALDIPLVLFLGLILYWTFVPLYQQSGALPQDLSNAAEQVWAPAERVIVSVVRTSVVTSQGSAYAGARAGWS